MKTNVLYCGDNLEIMNKFIEPESIDLIYIDPPFFSGKTYEVIFGDTGERRAFEDRWKGGDYHYINWLSTRLAKIRETLKPTGSIYIHLDWHIVHYMKVELDRIFGANCFRNEIIWHYRRWTTKAKQFQRMHDTILFYTRNSDDSHTFNTLFDPLAPGTIKRWKGLKQKASFDEQGKRHRGYEESKSPGVPKPDVWQISIINMAAKERLGYPTQKPEALLETIIRASSNPGDVVADFFCGCGTTLVVAQMLGRQWVGCDVSPTALRLVRDRLVKCGATLTDEDLIGVPKTMEELKAMKPFEFQNYVIDFIQGTHGPKLVGDCGIDGFTVFNRYPVQVKQQEHVGRPEIQKFESAIRAEKKSKGYVFAFGFTKPAYEEVARAKLQDGIEIELWQVQDLRLFINSFFPPSHPRIVFGGYAPNPSLSI